MAAALYRDFSALPPQQRNILRWHFQTARSMLDLAETDRLAREYVADLRAAAGRHPDDPGIRDLVAELSADSAEFAQLWSAHEIDVQRSAVQRMVHPIVGPIELDSQTLMVSCADQRLVFYTAAPGTPSHEALQLLRVVGVQNLGTRSPSSPGPTTSSQINRGRANG